MRRALWLPPLLALLLYLPTLRGGLVWDDPLLLNHPLYRAPINWAQALGSPFVLSPNYFRPLAVASFLLSGATPWINHLVNALLHTLNTTLVTLLVARLRAAGDEPPRRMWPIWLVGALYAVHPALTEGVAFISSRFDLLVTTFLLLALLADHALRGRNGVRAVGVGTCVLLAALSKEMAASFLLVLPLWHLATEAWEPPDADAPPVGPRRRVADLLRRAWPVYLATTIACFGYLGLRYAALGALPRASGGNPLPVGSPLQHGLLVARSLAQYAVLALWPFTTLTPIHHSPLPLPLGLPAVWLALALSLALIVAIVEWLRRDVRSGALAAAAVVSLLPVLNILPLELGGGAFVAERFLLFPLALLVVAVGRWPSRERQPLAVALAVLWSIAAVATVQLTLPHWQSDQTLWAWGLRRAPQSPIPYTNLALVSIEQGNPMRGLALADEALQRDPSDAGAHNHAGLALFHLGEFEQAEAAFTQAVELAPESGLYWSNLAGALRAQDRLEEAEWVLLEEALPRDPTLWVAHLNLGLVYLRADRPDLAAQALQQTLALAPPAEQGAVYASLEQTNDPTLWLRFSELLLMSEDPETALRALGEAELLGAAAVDVAVGRSAALIALGRLDEAEALLHAAVVGAPEDARLYHNLGMAARQRGDAAAARSLFERAGELAPDWELPWQSLEELAP